MDFGRRGDDEPSKESSGGAGRSGSFVVLVGNVEGGCRCVLVGVVPRGAVDVVGSRTLLRFRRKPQLVSILSQVRENLFDGSRVF